MRKWLASLFLAASQCGPEAAASGEGVRGKRRPQAALSRAMMPREMKAAEEK